MSNGSNLFLSFFYALITLSVGWIIVRPFIQAFLDWRSARTIAYTTMAQIVIYLIGIGMFGVMISLMITLFQGSFGSLMALLLFTLLLLAGIRLVPKANF